MMDPLRLRFLFCLLLGAFQILNASTPRDSTVVLWKGSFVMLELCQSLNSETAVRNGQILFKVAKNVDVDGRTVIAAGTSAEGRVVDVLRSGPLGSPGILIIEATRTYTTGKAEVFLNSKTFLFEGKKRFFRAGGEAQTPPSFLFRAWTAHSVEF